MDTIYINYTVADVAEDAGIVTCRVDYYDLDDGTRSGKVIASRELRFRMFTAAGQTWYRPEFSATTGEY